MLIPKKNRLAIYSYLFKGRCLLLLLLSFVSRCADVGWYCVLCGVLQRVFWLHPSTSSPANTWRWKYVRFDVATSDGDGGGVVLSGNRVCVCCYGIDQVPNLQVVKLMQSLKSRNFVKERYNWRYLYFFLTNEVRISPAPSTHRSPITDHRSPIHRSANRYQWDTRMRIIVVDTSEER